MTIAESYASLARMLEYPEKKETVLAASAGIGSFLQEHDMEGALAPFAEFVATSTLAELQEDYVATFDFNPAVAPYLGHHLHGDNQKKGAYLIRLKQEFGRYGYTPAGNELPDHLPLVLGFLAHLAEQNNDSERRSFIADCVLTGIEKLAAGFAGRPHSPWKSAVEAARLLCAADSAPHEEVQPC
ncbi:nitrate reductase molybdenum cofactor assembly chaperone [Geobacter sp. AOG1]|uniref:nitrate reductase molybdenum cofactor assembly chaperone n=1 Tax=Geobacter sp. AOG1 TaxID=1566346 RepID=UPI001CC33864|nr:nitrate reductase molybdenum cofactor assembly chaperone [Geobacter sp. AOG1]GFE56146.1 respiratory nitrate reductase subunit delta [Geobacter sp. AOG1]